MASGELVAATRPLGVTLYDMLKYAAADFYKLSRVQHFALNPLILQKPSNLVQLQKSIVQLVVIHLVK